MSTFYFPNKFYFLGKPTLHSQQKTSHVGCSMLLILFDIIFAVQLIILCLILIYRMSINSSKCFKNHLKKYFQTAFKFLSIISNKVSLYLFYLFQVCDRMHLIDYLHKMFSRFHLVCLRYPFMVSFS